MTLASAFARHGSLLSTEKNYLLLLVLYLYLVFCEDAQTKICSKYHTGSKFSLYGLHPVVRISDVRKEVSARHEFMYTVTCEDVHTASSGQLICHLQFSSTFISN